MTALDQALKFLHAFVESNEGRDDLSTLVKTSRRFLETCPRVGPTLPADRNRQLKQLLLCAIQGGYWDVAADICRDIAHDQKVHAAIPKQNVVAR